MTEMNMTYQFMVDFILPDVLSEDFMNMIAPQRTIVNELMSEGKIITYALSLETSRLWAIFEAHSEIEVMDLISDLPLTAFMSVQISMLTFYNASQIEIPAFSMN